MPDDPDRDSRLKEARLAAGESARRQPDETEPGREPTIPASQRVTAASAYRGRVAEELGMAKQEVGPPAPDPSCFGDRLKAGDPAVTADLDHPVVNRDHLTKAAEQAFGPEGKEAVRKLPKLKQVAWLRAKQASLGVTFNPTPAVPLAAEPALPTAHRPSRLAGLTPAG